jgi:hypothetical protein
MSSLARSQGAMVSGLSLCAEARRCLDRAHTADHGGGMPTRKILSPASPISACTRRAIRQHRNQVRQRACPPNVCPSAGRSRCRGTGARQAISSPCSAQGPDRRIEGEVAVAAWRIFTSEINILRHSFAVPSVTVPRTAFEMAARHIRREVPNIPQNLPALAQTNAITACRAIIGLTRVNWRCYRGVTI